MGMHLSDEAVRAVRERRLALSLTQKEAAAAAGITEDRWRVLEAGKARNPRPSTLRGVARALGWAPDAFARLEQGADPGELVDEAATALDLARMLVTLGREREQRDLELEGLRSALEALQSRVETLEAENARLRRER